MVWDSFRNSVAKGKAVINQGPSSSREFVPRRESGADPGVTGPAVAVDLELGALERLAELVAEKLDARQRARSGWVTAAVIAVHLDVAVGYVYAHANELGACTLGAVGGAGSRRRRQLPSF